MNFNKMFRSFRFAWAGVVDLIRSENNARFHFLATIITIILGFYLNISTIEWILILIQIGLVWSAEAFNTAIEKLADVVSPTHNPNIGKVKDLASGGVLILATVAFMVGLIIFLPKIIELFSHSLIQN